MQRSTIQFSVRKYLFSFSQRFYSAMDSLRDSSISFLAVEDFFLTSVVETIPDMWKNCDWPINGAGVLSKSTKISRDAVVLVCDGDASCDSSAFSTWIWQRFGILVGIYIDVYQIITVFGHETDTRFVQRSCSVALRCVFLTLCRHRFRIWPESILSSNQNSQQIRQFLHRSIDFERILFIIGGSWNAASHHVISAYSCIVTETYTFKEYVAHLTLFGQLTINCSASPSYMCLFLSTKFHFIHVRYDAKVFISTCVYFLPFTVLVRTLLWWTAHFCVCLTLLSWTPNCGCLHPKTFTLFFKLVLMHFH